MGRTIAGIIVLLLSAAAVIKTEWIIQNFGTNAWAEAKFGYSGGSRLLYKFMGLAGCIIGFMLITNLFGSFLTATLGKIFVR